MGKLLTRKQQWRRTRTRKHAWGDLPPEVLEAMLAVNHGGREKSFSWDYGYIGILGLKSSKVAEEANRREVCKGHPLHQRKTQESADETGSDLTAAAKSASGASDPAHIPRSMSCSSLSTKRTIFPRSSSRVELSEGAARREKATCRRVLGRRGVSFDTQVKMVLIPKRDEFNDAERTNLWWSRDDYCRFRQVLIEWKRRNIHRLSHTDNILSIDLTDIDEEDILHEESVAVAAVEATAAAAASAAAAAAAAAMAAATAASAAAATAVAAAAATAAEVAASHAREGLRASAAACEGDQSAGNPTELVKEGTVCASAVSATRSGEGSPRREATRWRSGAAAAGEADVAGGGDQEGEGGAESPETAVEFTPLASTVNENEGHETQEEKQEQEKQETKPESAEEIRGAAGRVRHAASFSSPSPSPGAGVGAGAAVPSSSDAGGGIPSLVRPSGVSGGGVVLLRRSFSIGEVHSPSSVHFKAVPLSEKQATVESLRTWRKSLNSRLAHSSFDHSDERERSVSFQHPRESSYRDSGRETAVRLLEQDLGRDARQQSLSGMPSHGNLGVAADGSNDSNGRVREEPHVSPIMVAFERARKEDLARQAEVEAERAASAAAMVEAAAAAAAETTAPDAGKAESSGFSKLQTAEHGSGRERQGVASDDVSKEGPQDESQVINLGLNDSPESAAVAAAAGIRMAAEGVSNLSLRARDSVENLQEMAEHGWGQLALSSSA